MGYKVILNKFQMIEISTISDCGRNQLEIKTKENLETFMFENKSTYF